MPRALHGPDPERNRDCPGSLQAISAATRDAARLVGADKEWGTIEPGKTANLLVVNGRPDRTIGDTRNIEMVVREGRLLDCTRLRFDPKTDPGFRPVSSVAGER